MPGTEGQNGILSSTGYRSALYRFLGTSDQYAGWRLIFENDLKKHHVLQFNCIRVDKAASYEADNEALYSSVLSMVNPDTAVLINAEAENDGRLALEVMDREFLGSIRNLKVSNLMKLCNIEFKEGTKISSYITELEVIKKFLTSAGVIIDEDLYTILALKGLPDPRFTLLKGIIKRSKPWPTWKDFKDRLQDEDCSAYSNESTTDSVMYSHSSHYSSNSSQKALKMFYL